MSIPYHYTRFKWDTSLDLGETEIALRAEGYNVECHDAPQGGLDISFNWDGNRDHLIVKADTLEAFLTRGGATLLQRKSEPFTERDMKLRKIVFDLYPHAQPAISISNPSEPEFNVK